MVITQPRIFSERSNSGVITSAQSVSISTLGAGVTTFEVSGTWTGQLDFEATVNGTDWVSVAAYPASTISVGASGTTQNGEWSLAVGGYNAFRVKGNNVTSGSATVYLDASAAAPIVQQVAITPSSPALNVSYNEALAVASGVETTIITINAVSDVVRIFKVEVSGENVALFKVKINGSPIAAKRSWWTEFNQTFDFSTGLVLEVGQSLTVTTLHNRPTTCNFEASVLSI